MAKAAAASSSPSRVSQKDRPRGQLVFAWSILGVLLLLVQAQVRLGTIAFEALHSGSMSSWQWFTCGVWTIMNAYMEGYRGFQMRFVPRVIARAHHLATTPGVFPGWLGPIYAMAYVQAEKKAKYAAWGVTCAVLLAIFVVRQLPQPWRGMVDCGVVSGLLWGTITLVREAAKRLRGHEPTGSPDLPVQADAS